MTKFSLLGAALIASVLTVGCADSKADKPGNGPIGIVEATFVDRFARFENMSAFADMESESPF